MEPSVGIVGGGIGGLVTALACQHAGLSDLTIYEQSDSGANPGGGVTLTANATRILRALKLLDAIEPASFEPQFLHQRAATTGFLIAQLPLGAMAAARWGAPFLHIGRSDLFPVLLNAASRRGIEFRPSMRCVGVTQNPDQATIRFADGTTVEHDVVVGADGIHSAVSKALGLQQPAQFTGRVAFRGCVPVAELPARSYPATLTEWLGPRQHFAHYYVQGGEAIEFQAVVEDPHCNTEDWLAPAPVDDLAAAFANWHPQVRRLIDAAPRTHRWAITTRDPLPHWTEGRVTLLGDACHPLPPFLNQGAASAVEDAWVLARMLEQWLDDPPAGLVEYEKYRRPRAVRIGRRAHETGTDRLLDNGWAIWKRNALLSFSSRFLPEMAMQREDWLYSYDAVNGFE